MIKVQRVLLSYSCIIIKREQLFNFAHGQQGKDVSRCNLLAPWRVQIRFENALAQSLFFREKIVLLNNQFSDSIFRKISANHEVKKYSRVEGGANEIERALAFATTHSWANSKRVIDQSQRALYVCLYVIKSSSQTKLERFRF